MRAPTLALRALRPAAVATAVLALCAAVAAGQPPDRPTAAALFERVLAEQGLDAAVARLRDALADTTEAYTVEPYELLRALPARLVLAHRRAEALALLGAAETAFADAGPYWFERANAHLRCADGPGARAALERARGLMPSRQDIPWMLDRLDRLVATARLQASSTSTSAITPMTRSRVCGAPALTMSLL